MRRRNFIVGLGSAAAWPLAARAQKNSQIRLVGILMPYPESDAYMRTRVRVFQEEFAKLGWSENSNVKFDIRWTTDNMDLVRTNAADLVRLKPDVIVGSGDRVMQTLAELTRSIPIVMAAAADPVASGSVESLARPGGNVTGFSVIEFSIVGKMLETLKQLAPAISRVGMVHNPDNFVGGLYLASFETFAKRLAVQPIDLPIHGVADIERAIQILAEQPNGGLFFPADVTTTLLRAETTALVARYRVPAIYADPSLATSGGLVSYSSDRIVMMRQAASYVDRILRGEKPGDLPIQQPTKYRLVINLKTAKALGLTIPETLLATADEVIQ
jgi:putative tryptophan/tyrosine transport system substrate-binding protein